MKLFLSIVLAIVMLALVAWQIAHFYLTYRAATGTFKQRFLAAFSDSATILWGRVVAFSGTLLAFFQAVFPQLDPSTSLGQSIAALFTPDTAKYWLAGMGVIGMLTEYFRRSRGSIDPITPPTNLKP